MSDDIITKDEAIDLMKAGLPCESNLAGGPWVKTEWSDFANSLLKFRKPPEPRRVAREFWIFPEGGVYDHHVAGAIRVREVLPGEAAVREALLAYRKAQGRMLERWADGDENVKRDLWKALHACEEAADRALGLIGEGS